MMNIYVHVHVDRINYNWINYKSGRIDSTIHLSGSRSPQTPCLDLDKFVASGAGSAECGRETDLL